MNLALAPEMQVSSSSFEGIPDMAVAVQNLGGRRSKPHPTQVQKCPRCDSLNTKFCYYNNYNLSQPRYFCKNCRRYWTKGGALRNVPVGGGCRKNKRNSDQRPAASSVPPASAADNQVASGASAASSSSSLVNGSDRSSIGFESDCNNTTTSTTTTNTGGATGTPAGVSSGQLFDGMNPINPPPPSLDPQARGVLLNSGNNLSSILDPSAYENAQFSCMDPVISSTPDWSRGLSMPWKQQQTLTSLLTNGIRTSLDGFLSQPLPLLEDINSLAEAATRSVFGLKTSAATVPWPSLQDDDKPKIAMHQVVSGGSNRVRWNNPKVDPVMTNITSSNSMTTSINLFWASRPAITHTPSTVNLMSTGAVSDIFEVESKTVSIYPYQEREERLQGTF